MAKIKWIDFWTKNHRKMKQKNLPITINSKLDLIRDILPEIGVDAFAVLMAITSHINPRKKFTAWPKEHCLRERCTVMVNGKLRKMPRKRFYAARGLLIEKGMIHSWQEKTGGGLFGAVYYKITTDYLWITSPAHIYGFIEQEEKPEKPEKPDVPESSESSERVGDNPHGQIRHNGFSPYGQIPYYGYPSNGYPSNGKRPRIKSIRSKKEYKKLERVKVDWKELRVRAGMIRKIEEAAANISAARAERTPPVPAAPPLEAPRPQMPVKAESYNEASEIFWEYITRDTDNYRLMKEAVGYRGTNEQAEKCCRAYFRNLEKNGKWFLIWNPTRKENRAGLEEWLERDMEFYPKKYSGGKGGSGEGRRLKVNEQNGVNKKRFA